MKEAVIVYWSDTCNRKAMAEAAAKEVREAYSKVQKEEGQAKKKDDLKATVADKPFVLIAANDFWGDGQWLRYWEERMKAYGVNLLADGLIVQNTPEKDQLEECNQLGKRLGIS